MATKPSQPLTGPNRDFHIEEYKLLRGELEGQLHQLDSFMRVGLLGAAAVLAWLATSTFGTDGQSVPCLRIPGKISFAWWIPVTVILLGGAIVFASFRWVRRLATYIAKLEVRLGDSELGWECQVATGKTWLVHPSNWVLFLAWIAALLAFGYAGYAGWDQMGQLGKTLCPTT